MNKNFILNDFLKLKEDGVIKKPFSTYEELLDVLSEMFSYVYDRSSDAQEAFDDLNNDLDGLLNKHYGVYTLGTKEWNISSSLEASDVAIAQSIQDWNDYYGSNLKSIDEVCDAIDRRVMKDMSNCGCDVHNALAMLCVDVFTEEHPFFVDLGEEDPRISFLE